MDSKIMPSQIDAPKVILKQTARALKKGKKPPIFTDGELLAWKGVWFKLVGRGQDAAGKLTFLLQPQVEVVQDERPNMASHPVQSSEDEGPTKLVGNIGVQPSPQEARSDEAALEKAPSQSTKD